jgi:D-amino-acid dehydrogenase
MATGADVVVIGGGLVGAALAFELTDAGASVIVVDRADTGRATDAGAGILSPATIIDGDDGWLDLCDAAGAHHERLAARLDTSWARCGSLSLATRPSDLDALGLLTDQAARRHSGLVPIDAAAARDRLPILGEVEAAIWNPAAARLDGRRCCAALHAMARAHGARHVDAGATSLVITDGRVVAVETDDGMGRSCDAVVIAGGAWSPDIARQVGVDIGVRPLRGQILHLGMPDHDTASWPIAQPVFGHYLVSWPDNRVAVGATYEDVGFDPRVTAGGLAEVLREALRVAPGLEGATLVEARVGLRPGSDDDRPYLGPLPGLANAFVATGHGPEGLLLGPFTARLVAQQVLDLPSEHDIEPYRPDR